MANKIQVVTLILATLGCLFAYKAWDDASMARKYSGNIPLDCLGQNGFGEIKKDLYDIKLHQAYLEFTCSKIVDGNGTLVCKQN